MFSPVRPLSAQGKLSGISSWSPTTERISPCFFQGHPQVGPYEATIHFWLVPAYHIEPSVTQPQPFPLWVIRDPPYVAIWGQLKERCWGNSGGWHEHLTTCLCSVVGLPGPACARPKDTSPVIRWIPTGPTQTYGLVGLTAPAHAGQFWSHNHLPSHILVLCLHQGSVVGRELFPKWHISVLLQKPEPGPWLLILLLGLAINSIQHLIPPHLPQWEGHMAWVPGLFALLPRLVPQFFPALGPTQSWQPSVPPSYWVSLHAEHATLRPQGGLPNMAPHSERWDMIQ